MDNHRGPAEYAQVLNVWLEKSMPILTPAGVALGFLLPGIFSALRPFVPWLFAVMTLSGAINLKVREFGLALRDPLPIVLVFAASHVVMPLTALFVATLVFRDEGGIISGYVLLYSIPTAVSGFIWVSMYRGDKALALALILIATIAAPLITPFTMSALLGTSAALDMPGIALSLVLMVVVPTVIGIGTNEISRGKVPRLISPWLNPLAKFCLILVIAANTAAAAPKVHLADPQVWIIAGVCVFLALVSYGVSRAIGMLSSLSPEKQVTVFFSTGLRNISAAATIAIEFFPEQAALPALLGILFQQIIAALMGRLFLGSRVFVRQKRRIAVKPM
ncbi:MAG: bile acid:sodium symporter [Treponema sp.]|jgi:tagaturonate reductase|nr:bile acid:sodium symporter [Treponema sp.]